MPLSDDEIKTGRTLLKSINDALKSGPWERSLFLRAIGKKLREIRDRFQANTGLDAGQTEGRVADAGNLARRVAARSGQVEVFISLYNASGSNIKSWEKQLQGLSGSIVTRPIFDREEHVRELIRSRINKKNEAYIVVFIAQTDILEPPGGVSPKDSLGHDLLVVREGAIQAKNITRFFHGSGRYVFKDNKLIRQGDLEYMDFI